MMVKSLVTHKPNLILFSVICCFKAGHPLSTCGDESLEPLLIPSTILKDKNKKYFLIYLINRYKKLLAMN